ncbi:MULTISPECIES: PucR family transcriptional regulator [unclassified Enterococcus]|uniref:PucR family transcriptional regulator n=1 Tax=unclassified Enterococcus TaxID=2608891 RepID=UPI001CE1DA77|nr:MULTISPECIES: PucR family transcriptional regulator [unclassified Enterococcus]MCA5011593.1 PucR family transcriptional regulator ligand-binding domain-containing protein [Enterococcus sp. S23]MCA5014965.1 PucR family transcriptional regulator ligand-binding domain-containing protein [Enterococcus sp. S22(2020)]
MTTLEDLLKIPRFSDLKLLTHPSHINTIVESIEISETPDVANFIPKRIFLLTTAMVYKDNQQALISLIDSLKEQEAAGIGIKVGRFIETIDPEVVAYANKIKFPIVQVPSTQPLGALLHQLLNYLWDTKTEQLSYALDIQKRFSDLLIHDVSIARFIADFGKMINTPVILLSPYRKVIAHSKHFTQTSKPAEYYVEQLVEKYKSWNEDSHASFIIDDLNQLPLQIAGFSVTVNTYFPHYLLILNPEQVPYPMSEFAVEQACLVLSFMLYKNQKVQESLELLKSDFLGQLIEHQQTPHQVQRDWLDLGANYGLKKSTQYQIVYAVCSQTTTTATKIKYQQEESDVAFQWLQESLPHRVKYTSIFKVKNTNHLAILIQSKVNDLEQILQEISLELSDKLPITLTFSLGNLYETAEQIASSFIEAKTAYEETLAMTETPLIHRYHPKGMKSLFEKMSAEDIHYFCETTLKELAYPTEDSFIELRKTLKCYLSFQCEISKTAKEMYLHRNTIKYRIDHCAKLLGKNIQDPINSLNLRLALELSERSNQH